MLSRMAGAVGLALLVSACSGREKKFIPTNPPDQVAIVRSATHEYVYDKDGESPIDAQSQEGSVDNPGEDPAGGKFNLKIHKAQYSGSDVVPSYGQVLAWIHSDRAYPKLNIQKGENYIWRDKYNPGSTDKWITYMVPEHKANKLMTLVRHNPPHEYLDGTKYDMKAPHIIRVTKPGVRTLDAFGVCFDDPACSSMHCGYSSVQAQ